MKNVLFLAILFFSITLYSQEEAPSYTMFQAIVLSPHSGHGQQLRAGLKAHNMKYHTTGANTVNVWAVSSGPRMGELHWIKGPMTWSDMDNPPSGEGHMDDWRTNVTPHADMVSMDFWRLNDDLNYMPEGFVPKVMVVRYFDIAQGKGNNAEHIFSTILNTYKANNYDMGLQAYGNQANADGERDWAIVWYHDSWSSMDKERKFWDSYEEKNGFDAREFFESWQEVAEFKGMEIFTLAAGLSAITNYGNGQ